MTTAVQEDEVDRWELTLAPQHCADLLVQVFDLKNPRERSCEFTFEIGTIIRDTLSGFSSSGDGAVVLSPAERRKMLRWARQLELLGQEIRIVVETSIDRDQWLLEQPKCDQDLPEG